MSRYAYTLSTILLAAACTETGSRDPAEKPPSPSATDTVAQPSVPRDSEPVPSKATPRPGAKPSGIIGHDSAIQPRMEKDKDGRPVPIDTL